MSVYYDSSKFTPNSQTFNTTNPGETAGGPQTVDAIGHYNFIGCYSEGIQGRAIAGSAPQAPPSGGSVE